MYELDKKKFGSFVASLRRGKGLTQKELAQRLYLSDKAVSKWETGVSIPDTAMLMPLAQELGVTVTELLACQRMEQQTMEPEEVESVVKTAITYARQRPQRGYQQKSGWVVAYLICLVLGVAGMVGNTQLGPLHEKIYLPVLLGGIFGAYFVWFAPLKLPGYYDENRIGGVMDGPFRMHLPGVAMNNHNWPYVLRVGRIWSCVAMAVWPLAYGLGVWLAPQLWTQTGQYVLLAVLLGGFFVPVYVTAKRLEK